MNWSELSEMKSSVSKYQIKKIHILKSRLGMDESEYRELLATFDVASSKELSYHSAYSLINRMQVSAVVKGVWNNAAFLPKVVVDNIAIAENKPTPKMLRAIRGIWNDVSVMKDRKAKSKALNSLIKRIVKVESIEALDYHDAQKMITTLRTMKGI